MQKRQNPNKTEPFEDVIPAFLTPDHITRQEILADESSNAAIDAKETALSAPPSVMMEDDDVQDKLHSALDENEIRFFMQPIVNLPQRHHKFYEIFGRLRVNAGEYLEAKKYLPYTDDSYILNKHDALLLRSCLENLRQHQFLFKNGVLRYFFNIKPRLLRDPIFIKPIVRTLAHHRDLARSLILEMHYNDFMTLTPAEHRVLDSLARLGCRFSLDHVQEIPTDVKYLRQKNVMFVKIDAFTLASQMRDHSGFDTVLGKKTMLEVNDIHLIVEKVEQEKQVLDMLDVNIRYGQGNLFGRPEFQGVYMPQHATG